MRNKKKLVVWSVLLLVTALLAGIPGTSLHAQSQNLLTNPNFEPPYTNGVANGWSSWYEDSGELCNTKPSDWDFVCPPIWSEEIDVNNYGLTGGGSSQHIGNSYMTWHAGVYQTVAVAPGSRVRFTASGYSRASNDQPPGASYTDWKPRMMVGIDPEGRGLWYEGVIWSATNDGQDSWQTISVEATAGASGKVSVYVSSQYRLVLALAHMDTWWDNATLEIVQPAATATPVPPPTSAVPPTPRATSTPRPDGAVVHIVEAGDTLFGIAIQYGVDVNDLRSMNAGSLGPNDMLQIGQEIVISGTPLTTEPTPVPTEAQPTTEPTTAPTTVETDTTGTAETASFCISAYHDRNGDDARQIDSEELLPNATITLVGTDGPAGTYTTDGVSEPYCFENLQPGDYVLRQTPPAGYQVNGAGEWGVILGAGQIYSRDMGYVRETEGGDSTVEPAGSETEEPETPDGSTLTDVLNIVIRVSGGLVLLLALVVAGLFIASRRR